MSTDSMYQEIILDHYKNPHHKGLREPYDAQVHHLNPTCGDEITLRVNLDGDTIADVSYDSEGCSISQASASVLTDLLAGQLHEGVAVALDLRRERSMHASCPPWRGHFLEHPRSLLDE